MMNSCCSQLVLRLIFLFVFSFVVFVRCLFCCWYSGRGQTTHTHAPTRGGRTAHSLFVHMFLCLLPCCPQFFLRSHCAFVFLFVVLVYCLFRFLFELFDLCFRSLFLFVLTLVLHLLSVGLNVALARQ